MKRPPPIEAGESVPRAFDGGRVGRITALGLAVAALGWVALVAVTALADHFAQRHLAATTEHLHADAVAIAECLIGSGFALALIGTMRTGFGALNRFFTAALDRSAARGSATAPPAEPVIDDSGRSGPAVRRPYSILADGSVEVETILGTRRFASMAEAREFI